MSFAVSLNVVLTISPLILILHDSSYDPSIL